MNNTHVKYKADESYDAIDNKLFEIKELAKSKIDSQHDVATVNYLVESIGEEASVLYDLLLTLLEE